MDFEDFEGFKRIKNEKHLNTEEIFQLLEKYQNEIGELKFEINLDDSNIIVDNKGKYFIRISIKEDEIIIERNLEDGHIEDDSLELDSSLELSQTDRLIEQIYDLLKDYIKNDTITEHITSAKKVLYMREDVSKAVLDLIVVGKYFEVTNEKQEVICEVKDKPFMKEFVFKNSLTKREEWVLKYEDYKDDKYTILRQPFQTIQVTRNKDEVKNIFEASIGKSKLKIAADYSDNHYLIELDEIVIGSIDCMDPLIKKEYRLEINDLNQEFLIIIIAVMMDTFLAKEYMDTENVIDNIKGDIDNIKEYIDEKKIKKNSNDKK